ncbi:MAG: AbrB/MazE/SpoVT family DNA-binding domain-containing protein [Eubacteriales bacterium]|nr:AbrB/MazE/SpoVT family DNA-binding domain-containing protein [Eubacteriales bacterium]
MMDNAIIYLDTYVLQQDMRIRLPKSILANLGAEKGVSKFDVFLDTKSKELILRLNYNPEEK